MGGVAIGGMAVRFGRGGRIAAFLQQFDEPQGGTAQTGLPAMNDADGPHEPATVQWPGDQRTGADFLTKRRLRQQ